MVLWVGVCVCVDSVCEHPLPLLASPRGGGGAWWSGLRRGGSPEKERGRERQVECVTELHDHPRYGYPLEAGSFSTWSRVDVDFNKS